MLRPVGSTSEQGGGPSPGPIASLTTSIGVNATASMDGATVSGGNANDPLLSKAGQRRPPAGTGAAESSLVSVRVESAADGLDPEFGGGLVNSDGSPTLLDCTFAGNFAESAR